MSLPDIPPPPPPPPPPTGAMPKEMSPFVVASGSDLFQWTDVTNEFLANTQELELGELLHDDLFGLFEAMSAIELMDPKMDAGMSCNRKGGGGTRNFNSAKECGHVKLDEVSYREHLGIVDHTLSCFNTWLEGHSLAQTVLTNLYLHSPHEINNPVQRAFSVASLKTLALAKEFLLKGGVYEEEDFQPGAYGFKLCNDVSEVRAGGMLREVEYDLQKVIRATRKKEGERRENEECTALYARIRFFRHLYLALFSLYKQEIVEAVRCLTAAKEQVPIMRATVHLGLVPEEGKNLIGFERLANQHLLPPTFPRYTEIKSRDEAIEYFAGLTDRLLMAANVTQINSYHAATDFFIEFSRQCSPCVLSRSVLQVIYQPLNTLHNAPAGAGKIGITITPFQDLLKDACRTFIAPPALVSKTLPPPLNSPQIKDCIDSFFCQASRPLSWLLQTFGHNRARQRDKIANLLEEFANIQEEADKLDTMLNAAGGDTLVAGGGRNHVLFFSTWLLYYVLRLMVRYILSGFELELYSAHEYPYLYWYLYELLFPWLTTCLHRADGYLQEHEALLEQAKAKGSKKGSKAKAKKKTPNTRPYQREIAVYQAYTAMCSGYFKLSVGLKKEKKIVIPVAPFDNEHVRYDHRFAPLWYLVTPPIMPYGQYKEIYLHTAKSASTDLFCSASRDFTRARQIFESLNEVPPPAAMGSAAAFTHNDHTKLVSVCKNNYIVSGILGKDISRKVNFEFNSHATFPTIKLV